MHSQLTKAAEGFANTPNALRVHRLTTNRPLTKNHVIDATNALVITVITLHTGHHKPFDLMHGGYKPR
jgi:hypothetical protein